MTAGDVTRRSLVRGAAWSLPVIALAVATPLTAASEPVPTTAPVRDRLTFNTHRAWDENPGGYKPKIGVDIAVMDKTGPDAIGPVVLLAVLVDAAGATHPAQSTTKIIDRGWGATPTWRIWFAGEIARGEFTVTLTATAVGVETVVQVEHERTVLR